MKNFWKFLNGKKTVITAIIMKIVDSFYVESFFIDSGNQFLTPDSYTLMQGIALLMFIGGVGHKVKKVIDKKK